MALLDELPQYVIPRIAQYTQAEQLQLLYAYTAPRHYHKGLCDAVLDQLLAHLGELSHQDVCMVVWSMASLL